MRRPPRQLDDLLACPACAGDLTRGPSTMSCEACGQTYPIRDGVPILLLDPSQAGAAHEGELQTAEVYNRWIYRMVMQSLLDDQIVLEVGAGNVALDDPCIIRTDVVWSPHVDVVADLHALPFRKGAFDLVFSLAVFEHLRNPFVAAEEVHRVLKDGGYSYHECNFVFPYHGYPHHYFNASVQGMEQVFAAFEEVRKGVAPFQMPSFALRGVLGAYVSRSRGREFAHGRQLLDDLDGILARPLEEWDIYFEEDDARYVAAGTYFAGRKVSAPGASIIPGSIRDAVAASEELQARFPDVEDLTVPDNVLRWAREEGRAVPAVRAVMDGVVPFNKRGPDAPWDRSVIHGLDSFECHYVAMGFEHDATLAESVALAESRARDRDGAQDGDGVSAGTDGVLDGDGVSAGTDGAQDGDGVSAGTDASGTAVAEPAAPPVDPLAEVHAREAQQAADWWARWISVIGRHHPLDGATVLVAGCGPGHSLQPWVQAGAGQVVAVEPDADAADRAGRRAESLPQVHVHRGSLVELLVNDASVDVVEGVGTLDLVGDVGSWFAEVARVLRPSGVALVAVPNRLWHDADPIAAPGTSGAVARRSLRSRRHATFATLRRRATAKGLEVVRLVGDPADPDWPLPVDGSVVRGLSVHRVGKFLAPSRHLTLLLRRPS